MLSILAPAPRLTQPQSDALFALFDFDGDGKLNASEFVDVMQRRQHFGVQPAANIFSDLWQRVLAAIS